MSKGEYLNEEGLIEVIKLKASLNKGLFNKLNSHFPNLIKVIRSEKNLSMYINFNWIELNWIELNWIELNWIELLDSFQVKVVFLLIFVKLQIVKLQIIFSQHYRDKLLLDNLVKILKCGNVFKHSKIKIISLVISNFDDINNKVIPFFNKYKIIDIKSLDFKDFCRSAEIVKRKDHLKLKGLKEIKLIKLRMNKNRYINID